MGSSSSRCRSCCWSSDGSRTDDEDDTVAGPAVDDVDVELRFEGSPTRDMCLPTVHHHPPSPNAARTTSVAPARSPQPEGHLHDDHHRHVHKGVDTDNGNIDVLDTGMSEFPAGVQTTTYDDMMEPPRNVPHCMEDSVNRVGVTTPTGSFPLLAVTTADNSMSPASVSHRSVHMQGSAARIKTSMNDSNECPNYTTIHHVPTFQKGPPPPSTTACNIVRYGSYGRELVDETTTPLGSVDRASRRSRTSSAVASARTSRSVSLQGSPRHGRSSHSSPIHGGGFVQATFLRNSHIDDTQRGAPSDEADARLQQRHDTKEHGNPFASPHRSPLDDELAPL